MAPLIMAACGGFVHDERIVGPYRLQAIDTDAQMDVSYALPNGNSIGRVPETVFAVGWDAKYVVAASHPHKSVAEQLDKSNTDYFYIIRASDGPYVDPSVSVRGPFNAPSYQIQKARLRLPQFTREIPSLK
jgi:hypothetical protein